MANFKNISFIFLLRFGHVIIDIYWMFSLEYWSYMTFLCFLMITIERWLPTIETVSYHFLCSFFVLCCKSFISSLIPIRFIFTCTISFFLTYGLWVAKEIFIGIIRYLTKTTHNTNYLYDLFSLYRMILYLSFKNFRKSTIIINFLFIWHVSQIILVHIKLHCPTIFLMILEKLQGKC